ncbi:MAG: hypothetical protein ACTSUV_02920 [Candidatus Ranarchaeia archaeon]
MDSLRVHVDAGNLVNTPNIIEIFLMSALVDIRRELEELKKKIEK